MRNTMSCKSGVPYVRAHFAVIPMVIKQPFVHPLRRPVIHTSVIGTASRIQSITQMNNSIVTQGPWLGESEVGGIVYTLSLTPLPSL